MSFRVSEPRAICHQPSDKFNSLLTYDNTFAYGVCDCCEDCRLCCLGTFCLPCFIFCLFSDAKEGCCSACLECTLTLFGVKLCATSHLSILRTKIRGTYKIHGSILEDYCYTLCCPWCAAIQLKQELLVQGETKN